MITKILTNSKIAPVDETEEEQARAIAEKEALTTLLQAEFGNDVGVEFRGDYELRVEVEATAGNIASIDSAVDAWEA